MNYVKRNLQFVIFFLFFVIPLPLFAAAGKVVIAAGEVFAIDAQDQRRPLQRRSDIFEGDTLITGADGRLQLRFEDNAILALRADSQLRISEYHGATDTQNERVLMDLLGGGFRTISGSFGKSERDAYQVRTPNASIGIRGTHYEAVFQSDTLTVGVYEGGIVLTNDQGSLNLGLDSQFVFAQVQAGNLPQGLLNPPENLNVPNTPDGGSDETEEEEGSDDADSESTDDDTDINSDSAQGPSDGPGTGANTDSSFDADDFNFSELEDALIELQQSGENQQEEDNEGLPEVDNTVELTEAEQEGLENHPPAVGILVMAPSETGNNGRPISENGPMIAYGAIAQSEGDGIGNDIGEGNDIGGGNGNDIGIGIGGSPFFVAYEDQDLNDDLSDSPNFVLRPDAAEPSNAYDIIPSFPWEHWNNNQQEGPSGSADAGENTGFNAGTVEQPFYYIVAEPTQAKLSGEMSFTLSDLETAAGGSMLNGDGNATGDMTVYFDSGFAEGGISYEPNELSTWNLEFSGNVNGATLNATLTSNSTFDINGQVPEKIDLTGNVNGIFTGGLEGGPIGMTGGFTAQSEDGEFEDYGVFQMEASGGQVVGQ